ncbi:MAG: Coenzyme F420 hydrogenase/dehydrogenase, beta subunit C-terminal domain [Clostridia bacterium]|nr:Coenzyme F420 hydrogenase/dehydrogenase, beta subunit C-terminal domain [Clostridia bacterium]
MNRIDPVKTACCGCGACASVCPKGAITMEADDEGFRYPSVDEALCVNCGLCVKACSIGKEKPAHTFEQQYFAAQHKDDDTVMQSSSGGIASALAAEVVKNGGAVYGAGFEAGFEVRHSRADVLSETLRFRGSKYVQSDLAQTMQEVEEDLRGGREVLFTGTPCQVHGLLLYLRAKRVPEDTLVTCDFVCHGVGSLQVWEDYVSLLATRHGSLDRYNFRGKEAGWHKSYPAIQAGSQNVSEKYKEKESFFRMYSSSVITRPSCYQCAYTSYERCADLTLADFWNIDKAAPAMNDDRGTSQVLVNSEKGAALFARVRGAAVTQECSKEDVWQLHLEFPTQSPKNREVFWKAYASQPFEQVLLRYGKHSFTAKCRRKLMPVVNKLGLYTLAGKLYKIVFVREKKQ